MAFGVEVIVVVPLSTSASVCGGHSVVGIEIVVVDRGSDGGAAANLSSN